jgi:hypothetical protein
VRTFGSVPYGVDINQLGASEVPRFSINQPSPYIDGLVEDVIVNESHPLYSADGSNLGDILVRIIPDDRGVPKEKLNWASPLEFSIQEFPLKNETVLIFYSFGKLYYTRPVNTAKKVTENSWPGLSARFSPISTAVNSDSAQLAAQGGPSYQPSEPQEAFTLGNEFKENPDVKPIRPNEGDVILQGRFGNIIRFGSSLFSNQTTTSPKANLLITVGQNATPKEVSTATTTQYSLVYEDINKDLNSIWLVTDETVPFEAATLNTASSNKAHLRSTEISRQSPYYTGAQIFVNSDRVILNSKKNEMSLFSKSEINLSAIGSITVDSEASVFMTANSDINLVATDDLFLKGNNVVLSSVKNLSFKTDGNYTILGKKIFIGTSNDPTEPMVLGASLASFLGKLIDIFTTQLPLTTVVTPVGPGTAVFLPVITGLKALQLSQLGLVPQSAVFNSTDNFVTKNNV